MGPRGEFSEKAQVTKEKKKILRFALTACVPTLGFGPEGEMVAALVDEENSGRFSQKFFRSSGKRTARLALLC